MLRSALLSVAGIVTALVVACVPPPPVPAAPPPRPQQTATIAALPGPAICTIGLPGSGTVDQFVGAVRVLSPDYVLRPGFSTYSSPANHLLAVSLTDNMKADLRQAFLNSPPGFRQELCDLNGIYISTAGCTDVADLNRCNMDISDQRISFNSWGLRSRDENGKRYVAISAGLWRPNSPAVHYHEYENSLLQNLEGWIGSSFDGSKTSHNESWMTVIAALAHELGHIRWYDVNVTTIGGDHNFDQLANACPDHGSFFRGWDRQDRNSLQAPRWRDFGGSDPDKIDHAQPPTNVEIFNAVGDQETGKQIGKLRARSQPWPSSLGARSPDEDFVETYKLNVLTWSDNTHPALLTSMPLTIRFGAGDGSHSSTVNIPQDVSGGSARPELRRKLACIQHLPYPPP